MRLLDILMPQRIKCIVCGKDVGDFEICDKCDKDLPYIIGKTCVKCGINSANDLCIECKDASHKFIQNFSIFVYKDIIQKLIIKFKQSGYKNIGEVLAVKMLERFKELDIPFDLIVPIPIHSNREKERGFNQSVILAQEIAKYYGRFDENVISRIKDTPHQTGLSKENRKINLDNAFKVLNKAKVKGKTILLIDDIYTTGSTLNECAECLYKSGADKVYGLCLARAEIKQDKYLD